ncbi:MAG: DUF1223 domain-containing protein [Proteobacteria bacterium]|nr:DUF1223 domain-containing protein [Pseudomonadota bacterium]MBW3616901.1 DUF1223 domain-containing protein [Pseudomonadota bacterium]
MRVLSLIIGLLFATPVLASGPVVVELYTSQACESCRQANAVVAGLAARPDVLPLTFSVDYWDYLGWTDTFARPEFSQRQQERTRALGLRGLRTPLVVVAGTEHTSGLQRGRVAALIRTQQAAAPARPTARISRRRVQVSGGAPTPAEVWLVRYDPRLVQVPVSGGPNKGRRVPHQNLVRQLVRLGGWTGRTVSYPLPRFDGGGLRSAVLVQAADGRILAAVTD